MPYPFQFIIHNYNFIECYLICATEKLLYDPRITQAIGGIALLFVTQLKEANICTGFQEKHEEEERR
jgi:hypothetical protein